MEHADPTRILVGISDGELDVAAAIGGVSATRAGGVAAFIGTVRSEAAVGGNEDKPVVRLEYEAHAPLAEQRLNEIALAASNRWGLARVTAIHRTGTCELGDATVVVACSAPHRAEALDACRWIIDQIKLEVPIWKREVYEDGSAWVQGSA